MLIYHTMKNIFFIVVFSLLPSVALSSCPAGCNCLPDLTIIKCAGKNLKTIPAMPPQAIEVDLSNNLFSSSVLSRSNLSGMSNIQVLRLKGCGLSRIENEAFSEMKKLKTLDLSFNSIQVLSRGAFQGLKLDYLYLESNPQIVLMHTAFEDMTTGYLSLKECDLRTVEPALFAPLRGFLEKLVLEGNKVERFPVSMLSVVENLSYLTIQDNPLICDCESKWLKEFYDLNKARFGDDKPRCVAPEHVSKSFFSQLSVHDFSCDKPTVTANITFTADKGILSCTSRGNPLPKVSWHRPNGVVSHSSPAGRRILNTNQIEVLASEPDVKGLYKCVASNNGGNTTVTLTVDWPFNTESAQPCQTAASNSNNNKDNADSATKAGLEAESDEDGNVFKIKYFTLVDLIAAVLGTFVCTLVITVVTLHFCVYRKKNASPYATPPMSEYSSSNGSDKNTYPTGFHPLQNTQLSQRPLPCKPYHKIYDEHHYMATNLDEQDDFIHTPSHSSQGRMTPNCDSCPACRTLAHQTSHTPS